MTLAEALKKAKEEQNKKKEEAKDKDEEDFEAPQQKKMLAFGGAGTGMKSFFKGMMDQKTVSIKYAFNINQAGEAKDIEEVRKFIDERLGQFAPFEKEPAPSDDGVTVA